MSVLRISNPCNAQGKDDSKLHDISIVMFQVICAYILINQVGVLRVVGGAQRLFQKLILFKFIQCNKISNSLLMLFLLCKYIYFLFTALTPKPRNKLTYFITMSAHVTRKTKI